MNFRSSLSFLVALLLLAGCDVFDPTLYMNADTGPGDTGVVDTSVPDTGPDDTGPGDTSTDTGTDSGAFALTDRCNDGELLTSLASAIPVDTTALSDRINDVNSCAGSLAPGNDGFFGLEMTAGERWHFHVTALEAAGDPVVYVLSSGCDPRTCQRGDATNNCNLRDEHFTYVAPSTGTFFVGVDDANTRGGTYEVLPIRPECGNGMVEHSESCDETSATCSADCQRILSDGDGEVEPNDDPAGANVLGFTSGTIQGDVASQCDLASFRFTAPAGATLTASVLPRGMAACTSSAPALDLELVSTDGRSLIGSVVAAPGVCPEIIGTEPFATGLAAGDYALRLVPSDNDVSRFEYDLTIDVSVP